MNPRAGSRKISDSASPPVLSGESSRNEPSSKPATTSPSAPTLIVVRSVDANTWVAVPALGLAKPPTEHPPHTHADALAAHFAYGLTTDLLRRALRHVL